MKTSYGNLVPYSVLLSIIAVEILFERPFMFQEFAHMLENEPHADKWIPCLFDNLKRIDLETRFVECEVLVIYQILQLSPNIETFVLSNSTENSTDGSTADITTWSECKLYRLMQVRLEYFYGFENEMNLVKFFIKNAENLKKLTLELQDSLDCAEELAEMTKILLACPRDGIMHKGSWVRHWA
ncbi:hypothetical protein ACHQM5_003402 [Ranunculus cassubicifolius]